MILLPGRSVKTCGGILPLLGHAQLMKKQKTIGMLVFFTTGFCLFGYIEFLAGLEPIGISHPLYGLVAGAALIGIACALGFFRLQWAAICALAGAAVALPSLWRQFGMAFGPQWDWVLTHYPDTSAAVVSLIVSSVYAVFQLWPSPRSAPDTSERRSIWPLPLTIIYAVTMFGVSNWPNIWALCFKLRYGT
jgi:hypothetical protein